MKDDLKSGAKGKNYFVAVCVLAIGGGFFLATEIQSPSIPVGFPQSEISRPALNDIAAQPNALSEIKLKINSSVSSSEAPNLFITAKPETHEKIIADDLRSESAEMETLAADADMAATGEFADQINFTHGDNGCSEACANNLDVNTPAVGEFAEQINADAIFQQALLKHPELQAETKLTAVPPDSHPSTEFGIYTPPPQ